MKKILLVIILIFLILPVFVKAQLPLAGVKPDSIFYSLDVLGEKIVLFFTFGSEKKITKALNYAQEKLAEIEAMSQQNKIKYIAKAAKNYQNYLDYAYQKAQKIKEQEKKENQLVLIAGKNLDYQEILMEMYVDASSEIKPEIEKIISASQNEFEKAISSLPVIKRQPLEEEQALIISDFEQVREEGEEEIPEEEIEPSPFTEEERIYLEQCQAVEFDDIFEIIKCYKELGRIFQNLELCNQAGEISGLGSCYGGVGAATENSEICNQFEDIPSEGPSTILLAACYSALAQIQQEVQICASAPTLKSRIGCYLLVAGLEKDVSICQNITSGREGCYILVASEKEDVTICQEIQDESWRNLCNSTLADEVTGKTELCQIGANLGLFSVQDCYNQLLGE